MSAPTTTAPKEVTTAQKKDGPEHPVDLFVRGIDGEITKPALLKLISLDEASVEQVRIESKLDKEKIRRYFAFIHLKAALANRDTVMSACIAKSAGVKHEGVEIAVDYCKDKYANKKERRAPKKETKGDKKDTKDDKKETKPRKEGGRTRGGARAAKAAAREAAPPVDLFVGGITEITKADLLKLVSLDETVVAEARVESKLDKEKIRRYFAFITLKAALANRDTVMSACIAKSAGVKHEGVEIAVAYCKDKYAKKKEDAKKPAAKDDEAKQ